MAGLKVRRAVNGFVTLFLLRNPNDETRYQGDASSRNCHCPVHTGVLSAAQLECGDWGSRSGCCDRAVPSLVCKRVRLFPCRRSVPTLSLQANMSKKQPKRDRRLFNRCDHRFGSLIISAGDRRCSCGTISIDDPMKRKILIVVFSIVFLGLLAFAYAYLKIGRASCRERV